VLLYVGKQTNLMKISLIIGLTTFAVAVPVFASTQSAISQSITLLPNQVEFIQLIDKETGTNLISLKNDPTVIMLAQTSTRVCGNIQLQKQTILALGGNTLDASYASNKFENVFCKRTY